MKYITLSIIDGKPHLHPDNDIKLSDGDYIMQFRKEATGNNQLLRKIRALYNIAWENGGADQYYSKKAMIYAIKVKAGYYEDFKDCEDGSTHFAVRSLAFDGMNDRERGDFLDDAITVCCEHICKTLDEQAMYYAIDKFLGFCN